MEDYTIQIKICPASDLVFRFMELSKTGKLTIRQGYAWDGASGLPITPNSIMRGSLIHDTLYQLMRLEALDYKIYRLQADQILRQCCIEDGATTGAASIVYKAVRMFGESCAKPTPAQEVKVYESP